MKKIFLIGITLVFWVANPWSGVSGDAPGIPGGPSAPTGSTFCIAPGVDKYMVTQATIRFGPDGDYPALPADFFEPGSDPFTGTVCFRGHHSAGGTSPSEDASFNRTSGISFSAPPYPQMGMTGTEILQLNMESLAPIVLPPGPDYPAESFFDVYFSLQSVPQPGGMASISLETEFGGTFIMSQSLLPVFTFVRRTPPYDSHEYTPATALNYTSSTAYPWTRSPIECEFDAYDYYDTEMEMLSLTGGGTPTGTSIRLSPLSVREDNFSVEVTETGQAISLGGTGFNDSYWYYYPQTNWSNIWFYDHPMKSDRVKYIYGSMSVQTRAPGNSYGTIVFNHSNPPWFPWTENPNPPLPGFMLTPVMEETMITRTAPLFQWTQPLPDPTTPVPIEPYPYLIQSFNPEWLSVDIRGINYYLSGNLTHVCFKPYSTGVDFGDAPAPYPTLLANNGARHTIVKEIFMGTLLDGEADGLPNANATGDDLSNQQDEDGVTVTTLTPGQPAVVTVTTSVANAFLQVWIDFNGNGSWADAGEQIATNLATVAGPNVINITVPANASVGQVISRFRFSTTPGLSWNGPAPNGEVEDHAMTIVNKDWGDAPSPYPTLLINNGACHTIVGGVRMGALVDRETDGQPNAGATGDDITPPGSDDEDGVTFSTLTPGQPATMTVSTSLAQAYIQAWIDFNGDGTWAVPAEQIATNVVSNAGSTVVNFTVPGTACACTTYARVRFSTAQNLSFTGCAENGEVEDYLVQIETASQELDFGDAPDPTYPTLLANDGARHIIDGTTYLGPLVDGESDGQPTATANGDDLAASDDEDGVSWPWQISPGLPCKIVVNASVANGLLNAWVDFNKDGDWADGGEQIYTNKSLVAGNNFLTFIVSNSALLGQTMARFRFSHQASLSYTGLAQDGEVEDYQVELTGHPNVKWKQPFATNLPGLHSDQNGWMADDWHCYGDLVTDIHWWGNYETDAGGEERGMGISRFVIDIYSNQNCLPGTLLQTYTVPFSSIAEMNTNQHNSEMGWIYYYEYVLPEPFVQTAGQNYWVSIRAISANPEPPNNALWRWQEANRWYDPILCGAASYAPTSVWMTTQWDPQPYKYSDMAYVITSTPLLDYGDAPDPGYPTLSANDGARHVNTGLKMGNSIDVEADGWQSPDALGDDINGVDDEDGVWWPCPFVPGQANTVQVTVSGAGYLSAWFDWNANGSWADPGEKVLSDVSLVTGTNDLFVTVPGGASTGTTFARFRFSSAPGLTYTGQAQDGEVEDYAIAIQPLEPMEFGDAPDPPYPTRAINNGARHLNDPTVNVRMGSLKDYENDGQPTANAKGDDNNGLADEDGVVFNTQLILGQVAGITVTANIAGPVLQGWFDWNQDGDWMDFGEQVFTNVALNAGPNNLNVPVPANALLGSTFARFRYSTMGNLMPYGCAPNGEVEDYIVLVITDNLAIQNATFASGADTCFEAQHKITTGGGGGTFQVNSGASVTLMAGLAISMLPKTIAQSGSYFHAFINSGGQHCIPTKSLVIGGVPMATEEEVPQAVTPASGFFKVYPNPTPGKLTLEMTDKTSLEPVVLEVYSLMGEPVLRQDMPGQPTYVFSLGERQPGVYILRVHTGGKVGTVKVIRQ